MFLVTSNRPDLDDTPHDDDDDDDDELLHVINN